MNESTTSTVTLYRGNKIDEAYEVDPATLPEQFIAALESDGYNKSGRYSIEFEYRWWLSGPEAQGGMYAAWDESDFDALWAPIANRINDDPDYRERVLRGINPHGS